jgi:hypothetical protein
MLESHRNAAWFSLSSRRVVQKEVDGVKGGCMPQNYEEISECDHRTVEPANESNTTPSHTGKMGVSVLTLDLTPELEFGLKREAGCRGIPPEQFALEALNEYVALSLRKRAGKVAELLRQWNEEEVDESETLDDEFVRSLEENRVAFREITLPD